MSVDPSQDELVSLDLTDDETFVLDEGLIQWGGPSRCSEELAVAMGFLGTADLYEQSARIRAALSDRSSISRLDVTRALLATEIVFSSDVMGAGVDWEIVTGLEDVQTLRLLRGLQRKLVGVTVRLGTHRDS